MKQVLKKSLKLAGALAIVLGAVSPVMATSASAEPYGYQMSERHDFDRDGYYRHNDHDWRNSWRAEYRGYAHERWRDGRWTWHRDRWEQAPRIWIRF